MSDDEIKELVMDLSKSWLYRQTYDSSSFEWDMIEMCKKVRDRAIETSKKALEKEREMIEPYKELGIIESASFGLGGYDGKSLGIAFTLGNGTWSLLDFWGETSANSQHIISHQKAMGVLSLLQKTGKFRLEDLAGTRIEMIFAGMGGRLVSWDVKLEPK